MIPFLDLNRLNRKYRREFRQILDRLLDKESFILGYFTQDFENAWAEYTGAKYAVGVASGYDALYLIFEAYKILGRLRPGGEVIIPAHTYIATILPVIKAGFKPVLTDPGPDLNMDAAVVEKKITPQTVAILPVHLYGRPVQLASLQLLARDNNLLIIDDAAQAHGAVYRHKKIGGLTDATAWSFYPTKNLGALGDAGSVTTNDKDLAETIRVLRNYGQIEKYNSFHRGINSRLDALQAGFLKVKLKDLDNLNRKRRQIADWYEKGIQNTRGTKLPVLDQGIHVYHQYVILSEQRDALKKFLKDHGIETLVHYPVPVFKQQALDGLTEKDFPFAERICREVLSLPVDPYLTEAQVYYIIEKINAFEGK